MSSPAKFLLPVAVVLAVGVWIWSRPVHAPVSGTKPTDALPNPPAVPSAVVSTSLANGQKSSPLFAIAQESAAFRWTNEDAKDTNVIRRLAHNDLEYERMVAENARIQRRQLVYHRDTLAAQIQRAKLSQEPLRHFVLPALDGREVSVEVSRDDVNPSGQQGTLTGRVAGKPDSLVTLAFKGGREAFTILSPAEQLYLVAEPREPGELIVKQIDPATYTAGADCGNP
ncbi:MAG: hypothetical protein U1F65_05025 [Verrucomicrobiota bacterium]